MPDRTLLTLQTSMTASQAQQTEAIQNIARQSMQNAQLLVQMQQSISSTPQVNVNDAITLNDPLGRKFVLPYTYFQQWEVS